MTVRARTTWYPILLPALLVALFGCKRSEEARPVKAEGAAAGTTASATAPSAPDNIEDSCRLVCGHQTTCLGAPDLAADCARICRDQAKLPEQQKNMLAAHKRIIAECFPQPCDAFDGCFRRVIGEETERVAKEVGTSANIEITPEARKAFKDLFCKIVKDSGGTLPNVADPNASPDIARWHEWMKLLAQDPTLMQQLLKEAEAECDAAISGGALR